MAWLTGFQHRKLVTLSRPSGIVVDYQMKLKVGESDGSIDEDVSCEGLIDSGFESIRFTNSDGITTLPYWIESISGVTPNQLATIWIKFDSIGVGDTDFYMYFGHTTPISMSSGIGTFDFFDNFDGAALDPANWFHWYNNGTTVVENSLFKLGGHASYNVWGCKVQFGQGYAFRGLCKLHAVFSGDTCLFGFDERSKDGTSSGPYDAGFFHVDASASTRINTQGSGTPHNQVHAEVLTNWAILEIQRLTGSSVKFIVGNNVAGNMVADLPTDVGGLFMYSNVATHINQYDWIAVRKILATEPTWGTWGVIENDPSVSTIKHGWSGLKWDGISLGWDRLVVASIPPTTLVPTTAEPINSFKFQIVLAAPGTFTLPINAGGAGYTHNFTVWWGDGSSSLITAYDDVDRTHTYAASGTYNITMDGVCEWFAFNNGGDRLAFRKILDINGDMGFKVLNFYGCSNLNEIVPLGTKASLVSFETMFTGCSSLTALPDALFNNAGVSLGVSFQSVFTGCSGLTSLPLDLFSYHPNSTNFYWCFDGCSGLTSLPTDLFRYNTNISYAIRYFAGCTSLTSLPADLFKYNTLLNDIIQTFSGCTGLTSLPADLFKSLTNCYFDSTFQGCTSLTTLPADLFRYCTGATQFKYVFAQCSSLATLPTDLFRYNVNATHFISVFQQCTPITTIPTDFFRYNVLAVNISGVFYLCSNITAIPVDLFRYNTLVTTFAYVFYGCSSITAIPADLFRYNTVVTTFEGIFGGCTGLLALDGNVFLYNLVAVNFNSAFIQCPSMTGTGQTVIDNTALPGHSVPVNTDNCFLYDLALTDYATLPVAWL